jgi:hypothetical protein
VKLERNRQLGRRRRRRKDSTLLKVIFKKWSRAMHNLNLLLDTDRWVGAEEYPALFQKTEGKWIGHILCRNSLLQEGIEGKLKGEI